MKPNDVISPLTQIVGHENLLTSIEDCATYGTDWTRYPGKAMAVVLPKSTTEVVQILKTCHSANIAVVPSGGRTGLAGGASVQSNQIALSLRRMNGISTVQLAPRTVSVQAGAITQSVHEHCEPHGLIWPIDLAAKGSSTIGGNLSTNAGGVRVVRYGMTRKWVSAIQAVMMDGTLLELNHGLEKNNTGYDLMQLLIGSEGTLAVITEATLKLARVPKHVFVCLLGIPNLKAALSLFELARDQPFEILACEFFSDQCQQAVQKHLKRHNRLAQEAPFYLLIEVDSGDGTDTLTAWLAKQLDTGLVIDGALGVSSVERKNLWALREGITESIALTGPVKKYDVAVPVIDIVKFLEEAQNLFNQMKLPIDLYLFGHLGDGSPHLNLVKQPQATQKDFEAAAERFEKELYPLTKSYRGSLSAEHGVGVLKKSWVLYSRTPAELEIYRSIKRSFDPKGLLNPGKIIDL